MAHLHGHHYTYGLHGRSVRVGALFTFIPVVVAAVSAALHRVFWQHH